MRTVGKRPGDGGKPVPGVSADAVVRARPRAQCSRPVTSGVLQRLLAGNVTRCRLLGMLDGRRRFEALAFRLVEARKDRVVGRQDG